MNGITFILTSCGRWDLLKRTMDSFLSLNDYPVDKFIISEDSVNEQMRNNILDTYGHLPRFQLIFNVTKQGLSKSLDNLIAEVETEYVFTCEDDWLFYGNRDFMEHSLRILQRNDNIHHVWIRNKFDHAHPLSDAIILNGLKVQKVIPGYQTHWNGFTFNPGLRRVADIKRMFPNGFAEFGDEIECAKHSAKFNYSAVSLVNSACKHIGWNRHTTNFKI